MVFLSSGKLVSIKLWATYSFFLLLGQSTGLHRIKLVVACHRKIMNRARAICLSLEIKCLEPRTDEKYALIGPSGVWAEVL